MGFGRGALPIRNLLPMGSQLSKVSYRLYIYIVSHYIVAAHDAVFCPLGALVVKAHKRPQSLVLCLYEASHACSFKDKGSCACLLVSDREYTNIIRFGKRH